MDGSNTASVTTMTYLFYLVSLRFLDYEFFPYTTTATVERAVSDGRIRLTGNTGI